MSWPLIISVFGVVFGGGVVLLTAAAALGGKGFTFNGFMLTVLAVTAAGAAYLVQVSA